MNESSAKRLTLLPAQNPHGILLVRTAAGPRMGFGHLKRTLILADLLRRRVQPHFLVDPDDRWSKQQVTSGGFSFRHFNPQKPLRGIETAAALLVDTRRKAGIKRLIAEARLREIPIASIHDLGLVPLDSDVAIDGSIIPETSHFPGHATIFFRGTPFCILDPTYARLHKEEKQIRPQIQRVVVNLGGGDGSRFFHAVLDGLRGANMPLEVIGLPGFCSRDREGLELTRWDPLRFRWFPQDGDVARLMFGADLVISAGGRSAYEALCVGAPLCALSWDRRQAKTLSALARAGACVNLGPGGSLKSADVLRRLCELQENHELRCELSTRGRKIVDGGGARRVAAILRRLMAKRDLPFSDFRKKDRSGIRTGKSNCRSLCGQEQG